MSPYKLAKHIELITRYKPHIKPGTIENMNHIYVPKKYVQKVISLVVLLSLENTYTVHSNTRYLQDCIFKG